MLRVANSKSTHASVSVGLDKQVGVSYSLGSAERESWFTAMPRTLSCLMQLRVRWPAVGSLRGAYILFLPPCTNYCGAGVASDAGASKCGHQQSVGHRRESLQLCFQPQRRETIASGIRLPSNIIRELFNEGPSTRNTASPTDELVHVLVNDFRSPRLGVRPQVAAMHATRPAPPPWWLPGGLVAPDFLAFQQSTVDAEGQSSKSIPGCLGTSRDVPSTWRFWT